MALRYLFLCPDLATASGGVAVIYRTAAVLREAGHSAFVMHRSPGFVQEDTGAEVPVLHHPKVPVGRLPRRKRLINGLRDLRKFASRADAAMIGPDDVLVIPEFMLADAIEAFPGTTKIVFQQNPFSFVREYMEASRRGHDISREFSWHLSIAEVCDRTFELFDLHPQSRFPVSPQLQLFPFQETKERLITYMPRKRRDEAAAIDAALRRRGKLGGYRLEAIDGVSQEVVARMLAKSRIFISFLKNEALGFPAAEAMASGCIVVGFTGFGTEEYFTSFTGVPVADGDLLGVVEAVEEVVSEFERDPRRLDEIRRNAAATVISGYSERCFREGVLSAWTEIDRTLSQR